jgi:hypothetical protein
MKGVINEAGKVTLPENVVKGGNSGAPALHVTPIV